MHIQNVHYTPIDEFELVERMQDVTRYQRLCSEYGVCGDGMEVFETLMHDIGKALDRYQAIVTSAVDPDEPDDLESVLALRPEGPRKLTDGVPAGYAERLRGAFYGRMAGCTLGAALEFESVDAMKDWAEYFGDKYPLEDYWSRIKNPTDPHYIVGKKIDLTRGHMDAVPPDDDTIYTLLGLLTMEQYGPDFTQEDMAEIWKRYLPLGPAGGAHGLRGCWWGERKMLTSLLGGMKLPEAGLYRNPNLQNIAAWTRADSFGYACPGNPEMAAKLAWKDASANHRRNGVYGSMFMAATIAAAFAVDDPMEAVRIGLTEIPKDCLFAEGIRWALEQKCANYREASDAVWARYAGMFNGSALTNALHVVKGLAIGGRDYTRVIGETVAMSGDNDCTGATAGSICGAVIGLKAIPEQWIRPFNGRMHIYLNEHPEYLPLEDVCNRFERLAEKFSGR